jgi:hypothetical protein
VEACGTKQNVHGTEVFVLKRYIVNVESWPLSEQRFDGQRDMAIKPGWSS